MQVRYSGTGKFCRKLECHERTVINQTLYIRLMSVQNKTSLTFVFHSAIKSHCSVIMNIMPQQCRVTSLHWCHGPESVPACCEVLLAVCGCSVANNDTSFWQFLYLPVAPPQHHSKAKYLGKLSHCHFVLWNSNLFPFFSADCCTYLTSYSESTFNDWKNKTFWCFQAC